MIGAFIEWTPGRKNSPGYVIAENGCHLWVGGRNQHGYGMAGVGDKTAGVHRIRYELEIGPIPEGMTLDHICNNGPGGCCNPHHCRPATHRENILRGNSVASRNAAKTHCLNGHELREGNLVVSAMKMRRTCLVCQRARNRRAQARYIAKKRRMGRP